MAEPLRLLFLTQCPPSLELGGSKCQLELAAELERRGWHCQVAGPDASGIAAPAELLAQPWDVVDWDVHLDVERHRLPPQTLSLARIPLLNLHIPGRLPWPLGPWRWRRRAQHLVRRWRGGRSEIQELADAQQRVRHALGQADAINTWNSADSRLLVEQEGIPRERLIELPPGLPKARLQALGAVAAQRLVQLSHPTPERPPRVVVLATFDFRKGCLDLPRILAQLRRHHPNLQLRLLGTRGLFRGEAEVRQFFAAEQQDALEVVPSFDSTDLPRWLSDVDVGLFPSYLEGFGIAVIEQLAVGLPVFAYDVPGPCDSLPQEWRVVRGRWRQLAEAILRYLDLGVERRAAILRQAQQRSLHYALANICETWDQAYRERLPPLVSNR